MRRRVAVVAVGTLGLVACTGDDDALDPDAGDGGPDDGAPVDRTPRDGPPCPAPTEAPPWLDAYLGDQVARLSGAADLTPGVRLADRATVARRTSARAHLLAELGAAGLTVSLHDYGTGANVVGELAATTAGATEWVVVGAHYDSVASSPGANDDATGVAAALAIARGLTAVPCRERGLKVVLFDQEEVGLIGSTAYATRQYQLATPIVAVHTIDQVGWDADDDLRYELELPTPALLAEYQAAAAVVGAQVVRTTTTGTDHTSFRERNFAAVGVTEEYVSGDTTPHYHRPTDTFATVERGYNALAVRLVTLVVARELGAD